MSDPRDTASGPKPPPAPRIFSPHPMRPAHSRANSNLQNAPKTMRAALGAMRFWWRVPPGMLLTLRPQVAHFLLNTRSSPARPLTCQKPHALKWKSDCREHAP